MKNVMHAEPTLSCALAMPMRCYPVLCHAACSQGRTSITFLLFESVLFVMLQSQNKKDTIEKMRVFGIPTF